MRTALALGLALVCAAAGGVEAQNTRPAPSAPPACSPSVNGLSFICGIVNPEDLVLVPGTRWLIASGYDPGGGLPRGSGLALVDAEAKTFTSLYAAAAAEIAPEAPADPKCTGAPPADFVTHGLYLRGSDRPSRYVLYAVAHAPREAIEVFSLDASGARPRIAWHRCLSLPTGMRSNSVAAFGDGTVLVTVPNAGITAPDGSSRGVVLEWKPGATAFQTLGGTALPSNNGIEVSRDDKEFFVAGFGDTTIYAFARENPAKPIRSSKTPGFVPDNLRWSGERLIATGPVYDEPACGGTRREASQVLGNAGRVPGGGCNRGYVAAALDPVAMTWKVLAYAEPNPQIGIISVSVVTGDTLWVGAALSPGLAYRRLPQPPR